MRVGCRINKPEYAADEPGWNTISFSVSSIMDEQRRKVSIESHPSLCFVILYRREASYFTTAAAPHHQTWKMFPPHLTVSLFKRSFMELCRGGLYHPPWPRHREHKFHHPAPWSLRSTVNITLNHRRSNLSPRCTQKHKENFFLFHVRLPMLYAVLWCGVSFNVRNFIEHVFYPFHK